MNDLLTWISLAEISSVRMLITILLTGISDETEKIGDVEDN
jgi:hypothetical protein